MPFLNRYRLLIIVIIELFVAANVKWSDNRWKEMVSFDGKGYYANLPAVFIYHDLHYSFNDTIEKKYSSPQNYYNYRVQAGNGIINKYFIGTSVLQLPFFLLGHLLTSISGNEPDGYSFFYMFMISIASLFYGFVGLYFLQQILRKYGISENVISISIITIAFGTHLFNYTVFDPSLSHVYSFAAITCLLYNFKKLSDKRDLNTLPVIFLLAGLIFLIRPVNILIVLIFPFIAGSKKTFVEILQSFFRDKKIVFISLLIFVTTISIQFIFYFLQCRLLFPDSYPVEHFIWSRPEMIKILFSYRKGLFVYTPVAFISLGGLYYIYKKSKLSFFSFLLFFLAITYVFSCWWAWWYGGSFSSRPYVEFLGVFGILLAFLLNEIHPKKWKAYIITLLGFFIVLCQVQTYQFRYYIIHWSLMDKEHYWRVFMRVDQIIKKENANKDLLELPEEE